MVVEDFTKKVVSIIKSIPEGKVVTYGQVAFMAGKPNGARQISWILNSMSEKESLPWHRVINSSGKISLPEGFGFEEQMYRLKGEGIEFDRNNRINLKKYLWQ
ncbi:MAG: MGMT family protein [Candidatus Aminicenantes bacterium]|nr:MGMT family protein [Candidatus Aminicenantes bacterium]